jgi:hypothetical protein
VNLRILLPLLLALTTLQGCHSSSSNNNPPLPSAVRLVNAAASYPSLDLIASGSALASAVAYGSASDYASLGSASYTFLVNASGPGTTLARTTLPLSAGVDYTLVAYTSGQQLQVAAIIDNAAAPASGDGKIQVLDFSPDAGNVSAYMTGAGGTLSGASTLATTGYSEITAGNYHVWITGAGNQADLRLDLPSIVISDQQVLTLMLTGTTGGVLVDGFLVTQAGAVSKQPNGSARVRLVANIDANGSITATANGVSLASPLRSPIVGPYTLVPAGALSMNVTVNGNPVAPGSLNAVAGADLTLLAVGPAGGPSFYLLNDDNRLPLSGTAKLRLVNGVSGLGESILLDAGYLQLVNNVAPGTASAAASVPIGNPTSPLVVSTTQTNTQLYYLATGVTLVSPGVYSLFMLGNNAVPVSTNVVSVLTRDR